MTDASRTLCRRLSDRIREIAPPGIGRWDPAWEMVEAPSVAFLERLREWEAEDTPETRARLNAAAAELLEAWKRAARAWEDAGAGQEAPSHA